MIKRPFTRFIIREVYAGNQFEAGQYKNVLEETQHRSTQEGENICGRVGRASVILYPDHHVPNGI